MAGEERYGNEVGWGNEGQVGGKVGEMVKGMRLGDGSSGRDS